MDRLGLARPELRAWVAYDWANSVFMTSVIQVFQVYFANVAAAGLPKAEISARFYSVTAVSALVVAVMGPSLGAFADFTGMRKRLMGFTIALGVAGTFGVSTILEGEWRASLIWYAMGSIGIALSFILYGSLLPHVAKPDEVDRVSSSGYAFGYLSGGLVLALNLVWIANPSAWGFKDAASAMRGSFFFAGLWWTFFSLPFFKWVREPPPTTSAGTGEARAAWAALVGSVRSLRSTFADLKKYRDAFLMMIAFLIYNDGVNTVIEVGATYATELGIPQDRLLFAILAVQFIGLPFAFIYARLAETLGTRRAIYLALGTYLGICGIGYVMTEAWHFFVLAFLIGTAQGGVQALSRSLFASLIPKEKSSEFFGFYGVGERFAGIAGPTLFWFMVTMTGSSRGAILGLGAFFILGGFLLSRVDVDSGRALVAERR